MKVWAGRDVAIVRVTLGDFVADFVLTCPSVPLWAFPSHCLSISFRKTIPQRWVPGFADKLHLAAAKDQRDG